jgi:hypothetical protein
MIAMRAVIQIQNAEGGPVEGYAVIARSALGVCKRELKKCPAEDGKKSIRKCLNTAYYHVKNSERLLTQHRNAHVTVHRVEAGTLHRLKPISIAPQPKPNGKIIAKRASNKKSKRKKASVWTVSGGGFETNRSRH